MRFLSRSASISLMLVASITRPEEINQVGSLADLIELRLDHFLEVSTLPKPPRPTIFTFRKKEQGGARDLPEGERLSLLEQCLALEPEYCDIEADTDPVWIERMALRFPKIKWIGSYHNFEKTPDDLPAVLQGMKNPHFSIYKIALQARSTADMLRLMAFTKTCEVPLSAISMGEYGKPSRVLGKVFGSVLSYAGLQEDITLGRYSLKELHEIFRFSQLNEQTQVYALIGDPVEQSPGHIFHNAKFQRNAVYVKMRIPESELEMCFPLIRKLGFSGLSVTIPLKEAIVKFVEDTSGIGAVNTICGTKGFNTDGIGALNAIEAKQSVKGKRVAILGAGGTARAIAFEAKKRGATISIYNRTLERAHSLGYAGYHLDQLADHDYDILINTTPTSLKIAMKPSKLVMDVVYSPKKTPLLQEAMSLGCQCVYGEEMFNNQALQQQDLWKKN